MSFREDLLPFIPGSVLPGCSIDTFSRDIVIACLHSALVISGHMQTAEKAQKDGLRASSGNRIAKGALW